MMPVLKSCEKLRDRVHRGLIPQTAHPQAEAILLPSVTAGSTGRSWSHLSLRQSGGVPVFLPPSLGVCEPQMRSCV